LAFLSLTPSWVLSRLRAAGFAARAAEAGVIAESFLLDADPAIRSTYGSATHVRPTAAELVDAVLAYRPAGLFVDRDESLIELNRLLVERGIRVGEDLTIIACDNEQIRLSTLDPRPASIDLNAPEIAVRAVRRLIGRIKHPDESPVRLLVSPRLALPPTVSDVAASVTPGRVEAAG
jgi:DNA-binding LacI/PurR family transcriptional regulator